MAVEKCLARFNFCKARNFKGHLKSFIDSNNLTAVVMINNTVLILFEKSVDFFYS